METNPILILASGTTVALNKAINMNASQTLLDSMEAGESPRNAFVLMLNELTLGDERPSVEEISMVPDEELIKIGKVYLEKWDTLKKNYESLEGESDFFNRFAKAHEMAWKEVFSKLSLPKFGLPEHVVDAIKKATQNIGGVQELLKPNNQNANSMKRNAMFTGDILALKDFKPASVRTNELLQELIAKQDENKDVQQAISDALQSLLASQVEIANDAKKDSKMTRNQNWWILVLTAAGIIISVIGLLIQA